MVRTKSLQTRICQRTLYILQTALPLGTHSRQKTLVKPQGLHPVFDLEAHFLSEKIQTHRARYREDKRICICKKILPQ